MPPRRRVISNSQVPLPLSAGAAKGMSEMVRPGEEARPLAPRSGSNWSIDQSMPTARATAASMIASDSVGGSVSKATMFT